MKKIAIFKIFLFIFLIITIITSIPLTVDAANCDKSCKKDHGSATGLCSLCGHFHDLSSMAGIEKTAYESAVQAHSDIFNFQTAAETGMITCPNKKCKKQTPVDNAYCIHCNQVTSDFTIESILAFDTKGTFAPVFNAAETLYQSVANLGALIVFIYFLLEIAEVQLNDGFTYESLARHAVHTIIAFLLIINGFEIAKQGINWCNDVLHAVSENAKGAAYRPFTSATCPYREATSGWLYLNPIGMAIYYAIPQIVMTICFLIIRIICWSRVLDIMVRVILAPIGMADMVRNGSNSNGVKYLKKLLASVLQGAVIVGVFMCYNELCNAIRGGVSGFIGAIVLGLAVITVIKQTSGVANDIMGVQ